MGIIMLKDWKETGGYKINKEHNFMCKIVVA